MTEDIRLDGKAGGFLIPTRGEPLVLIPLSMGGAHGDGRMKYALIDAADYPLVKGYKWHAQWVPGARTFYASSTPSAAPAGCSRPIYQLHRVLLGLEAGDGLHGDHVDHVTLDNRRVRLRSASPMQSSYNRKKRRNNTSGLKGAFLENGRWRAMIRYGGRLHHLGTFDTREEAGAAYDHAAREHHGEFARTNAG